MLKLAQFAIGEYLDVWSYHARIGVDRGEALAFPLIADT